MINYPKLIIKNDRFYFVDNRGRFVISFKTILCQHKNYFSYDKCNNVYKILFNTLLWCMFKSVI